MQIFEVNYSWYDGDNGNTLLAKRVTETEFENDLLEAKKFAESLKGKTVDDDESYIGKGYNMECLPEYYEQIIYYMKTRLNYIECFQNKKVNYSVWEGNDTIEISEYKKTNINKVLK